MQKNRVCDDIGRLKTKLTYKLVASYFHRLRTELEVKFESWGEVKAEDGTVIDKDLILNCLNDKINDYRMKQLWDSIQCMYTTILNKYSTY